MPAEGDIIAVGMDIFVICPHLSNCIIDEETSTSMLESRYLSLGICGSSSLSFDAKTLAAPAHTSKIYVDEMRQLL